MGEGDSLEILGADALIQEQFIRICYDGQSIIVCNILLEIQRVSFEDLHKHLSEVVRRLNTNNAL